MSAMVAESAEIPGALQDAARASAERADNALAEGDLPEAYAAIEAVYAALDLLYGSRSEGLR